MENSSVTCQPPSSNFQFKYVAEEELLRIVRRVRREKQKERDALIWKQHLAEKEKNYAADFKEDDTVERGLAESSCLDCKHVCHCSDDLSKRGTTQPTSGQESISPGMGQGEAQSTMKSATPTDKISDSGVTARETGYLQRIAMLRHKISLALDSITGMIHCRPTEPDGPDDFERRKTRINEFLSRFSRNYLFQFQRQVAELRRQMVYASPETPGRHTEYQALMQKLVSAHQTAVQSLQAYLTQIPASLQVTNIFGKLEDLLHHLCDLSSLKSQLDVHAGIIDNCDGFDDTDEVYAKCKELLGLLGVKRIELEDQSMSARASSPLSGRNSSNRRPQRQMYRSTGGMRSAAWKKSSAYLARSKFGPPSSARSSVSPHLSSRELQLNEKKFSRDGQASNCHDSELKDIINHMHDVLCNKLVSKKKKRHKHSHKFPSDCNTECNRKSVDTQHDSQKPLTEVKNISKNVQFVITKHCDTKSKGFKDVATDTADLNSDQSQQIDGECKKAKKVGWVTANTNDTICSYTEDVIAMTNSNRSSQCDSNITVAKVRNSQEQGVINYRQRFQGYNSQVQNPQIQRWCEDILDEVFQEISEELEPSFLLEKMYHLEFKDT